MPLFSPTIISGPPAVQITMAGGITYEEFSFMLGILQLNVRSLFLESSTGEQVDANLLYQIFNVTGQRSSNSMKPRKDPYQLQNSLLVKPPPDQQVILNGQSSVSFNIFPFQLLTFSLLVEQIDPSTLSPTQLADNFDQVPNMLGNFRRFKDRLNKPT